MCSSEFICGKERIIIWTVSRFINIDQGNGFGDIDFIQIFVVVISWYYCDFHADNVLKPGTDTLLC